MLYWWLFLLLFLCVTLNFGACVCAAIRDWIWRNQKRCFSSFFSFSQLNFLKIDWSDMLECVRRKRKRLQLFIENFAGIIHAKGFNWSKTMTLISWSCNAFHIISIAARFFQALFFFDSSEFSFLTKSLWWNLILVDIFLAAYGLFSLSS